MGEHCDKGPAIEAMKTGQQNLMLEQHDQNSKLDRVLSNQNQLSTDMKQAIESLTRIVMTDIDTRKDVEQLKKDREILFEMHRLHNLQIININERNAKMDGVGVVDNFPRLWNWYQQHEAADLAEDITLMTLKTKVDAVHNWYLGELGWRRFIPVTLAAISTCLAIYVAITNISAASTVTSYKRSVTTPAEQHE